MLRRLNPQQENPTVHMTRVLSPSRIMEVGMGFWPSKVLLSALELELFSSWMERA
jgi:hypothetical protein